MWHFSWWTFLSTDIFKGRSTANGRELSDMVKDLFKWIDGNYSKIIYIFGGVITNRTQNTDLAIFVVGSIEIYWIFLQQNTATIYVFGSSYSGKKKSVKSFSNLKWKYGISKRPLLFIWNENSMLHLAHFQRDFVKCKLQFFLIILILPSGTKGTKSNFNLFCFCFHCFLVQLQQQ